MLKAVLPVPPVMLYVNVSLSASVATTVSTAVLLAVFSARVKV